MDKMKKKYSWTKENLLSACNFYYEVKFPIIHLVNIRNYCCMLLKKYSQVFIGLVLYKMAK